MKAWVIAAAAACLALDGGTATAEPLKIRAGWVNTPATMSPLLFQKPEILKHYGKAYVVEAVKFAGSTEVLAALHAGKLEIGAVSYSNVGAGVVNQGIKDLRIVADGNQGGVDGYASVDFYVRNDSDVRSIADLKGKVLATNGIGGAADFGLRAMLYRSGLQDKRDVTIVAAPFPTLGKLLLEGKVALVSLPAPFSYDPAVKAGARKLFSVKDGLGPTQQLVTTAMRGFLESNRAALHDFFEDYVGAMRWFTDPGNRNEAIRILAKVSNLPETRFASWAFTRDDFYRDPSARPNVAALTQNLATLQEMGFLPLALDPGPYLDLSFVEEAARRLK
jgi:sulfonate transport system substrate-binding protein